MLSRLREIHRELYPHSPTLRVANLFVRPAMQRTGAFVSEGYDHVWGAYEAHLDRCQTVEEWLCIDGFDDAATTHMRDGRLVRRARWDSNRYWHDEIEKTIREHFPRAKSITEYGCGVGRNVIALSRRFPEMKCYGYELVQAGVNVADRAAKKFGLDIEYAQLDYVRDPPAKFIHPESDLALTVFSLEQIPYASGVAVKNMLDHSKMGSIHVEPVPENYPKSYLGVLGRVYSNRVNYLRDFDAIVRSLPNHGVSFRTLPSSHNPLIPTPSVYTIVK